MKNTGKLERRVVNKDSVVLASSQRTLFPFALCLVSKRKFPTGKKEAIIERSLERARDDRGVYKVFRRKNGPICDGPFHRSSHGFCALVQRTHGRRDAERSGAADAHLRGEGVRTLHDAADGRTTDLIAREYFREDGCGV